MSARILLVEDSPTILSLLSSMLRQFGFSVNTAGDGVAGLEVLTQKEVDLIITDVNMPRMDGFTFIAKVRAQEALQKIPIIVLSTEKGERDRQEGRGVGANLYLTKPIQPQVLVDHVNKLLG
jgi:two-component system chemotaxis response regulator CheY